MIKILGKALAASVAGIAKKIFTQKVMMAIMVKLGDYLVKESKNKLDDIAWPAVRKQLI